MKPFTIALIGPDGAGKTTIALRVVDHFAGRAHYLYMGINPESARQLLPTTRLIRATRRRGGRRLPGRLPRTPEHVEATDGGGTRAHLHRRLATARSLLRLLNTMAEESYRQVVVYRHLRRGQLVLLDRHFLFDYYFTDVVAPRTFAQQLHGLFLERAYPRPDLVIYLDAPPELLLARKGEGTLESLAIKRRQYLSFGDLVAHFVVVDGAQPLEDATRAVVERIDRFAATTSST